MKAEKSSTIKLCIVCLSILFLWQSSAAAVSAQQANKLQERRDFWLSRAEEITYDSLKDVVFLSPLEQSILYAKLGEAWSSEKPEQARLWLLKAVYAVEVVPNRENPAEKKQRLDTARLLFKIVSRVDKSLSNRLLNVFTSEPDAVGAENQQIADALIESALSVVDKNPQRAVELGTVSMRFGSSPLFASLIWRLQIRSPDSASKLFLTALAAARENRNEKWLSLLGFTAFAEADSSGKIKSDLPQALQTEVLKLYLESLQGVPVTEENQKNICRHISVFIIPYQTKFNQLLPIQAEQIKPVIARCHQNVFTALQKEAADKDSETRVLKTVDDYLSAAEEENDLQVKTVYQYKAAQMAFGQRNYQRAISILDNMSEESRRLLRRAWAGHRWEWAAEFAFQLFRQGAELEMQQVLEKVPSDLKGLAQIALAERLPDKTPPALVNELLGNARNNLSRSSKLPDSEKIEGHLVLMRLYAKYKQIDEAADALKEVAKLANQATSDDASAENKKDGLTIFLEDEKLFLEGIPALIFERREHTVKDAVNSINPLPKRLLARLELLSLCLSEYKTVSASLQKLNKPGR